MKVKQSVSILIALLITGVAQADPISGEAELGWVATNGNSETDNLTFKGKLKKSYQEVTHHLTLEALNSSSTTDGAVSRTAERYLFNYKVDYAVSEKGYAFASVNYEKDRFSGYGNQTSELLGYGHHFHKTETLRTSAEIALGARQSKLEVAVNGSDSEKETVAKALANIEWNMSETTLFSEELSVEVGDENTISKSVTSLKVNMNSSLAMKLTYTIKHNSEVPLGSRQTDSESIVTLVYGF